MKSILLLTLSLALVTGPVLAQTPTTSSTDSITSSSSSGKHSHLLDQLNLSSSQKSQIAEIKQSGETKKQKRAGIKAVLTPAQRKELRRLRKENKLQGNTDVS